MSIRVRKLSNIQIFLRKKKVYTCSKITCRAEFMPVMALGLFAVELCVLCCRHARNAEHLACILQHCFNPAFRGPSPNPPPTDGAAAPLISSCDGSSAIFNPCYPVWFFCLCYHFSLVWHLQQAPYICQPVHALLYTTDTQHVY